MDSYLPFDATGPADTSPTRPGDPVDTASRKDAKGGGMTDMGPRTIWEGVAKGGYDQEGDQSYPASGPRITASTRGAQDIASKPTKGMVLDTDNDGE